MTDKKIWYLTVCDSVFSFLPFARDHFFLLSVYSTAANVSFAACSISIIRTVPNWERVQCDGRRSALLCENRCPLLIPIFSESYQWWVWNKDAKELQVRWTNDQIFDNPCKCNCRTLGGGMWGLIISFWQRRTIQQYHVEAAFLHCAAICIKVLVCLCTLALLLIESSYKTEYLRFISCILPLESISRETVQKPDFEFGWMTSTSASGVATHVKWDLKSALCAHSQVTTRSHPPPKFSRFQRTTTFKKRIDVLLFLQW